MHACGIFSLQYNTVCFVVFAVKCPINAESLYQYASLVTPRRRHVTFTPLDETELPKDGHVVGLDAEFVTLNQVKLVVISFNLVIYIST